MPRVELWLGNEKKTIHVREEEVCDYLYMYPEPEPMTYCGDSGPPQNTTFQKLRYKIDGWKFDPETGERVYKAVQI